MTLRALPHDVRSILCASAQINSYKTAIEELVYNSLDAQSTSIAIRVHIPDNRIQVIDNGCGILKNDFDSIGQRHMTSKLTDVTTLKSIPKFYGYRGEFLANVLAIAQSVKVISRHKDEEKTLALTFIIGKRGQVVEITKRPSKGTTVEIKGFLYNLNIQKQGIDPINELQNIKALLEQLSIVHNDISLSLRDDSTNEIIFQIHKKRNIYQTFLTLFDINQTEVKELQIEKNQYKVVAFIGSTDTKAGRHWIYVNRRFIPNSSKLHTIIHDSLKKYSVSDTIKKVKSRNQEKEEEHLFKSNIPFYFILITCPFIDYDIGFASCQFIIEFKNWGQINKILEKFIKFYTGDINLKEIIRTENIVNAVNTDSVNNVKNNTQCQIKKIVENVLGNTSKKVKISQLHNGIKGKLVTRKKKKKTKGVTCHKITRKVDNEIKSCHEITSVNHQPNQDNIISLKSNENLLRKCVVNNKKRNLKRHKDKYNSRGLNQNKINKTNGTSQNPSKTSKIKNKKKKKIKKINMSSPKSDSLSVPQSLMKNNRSIANSNKPRKRNYNEVRKCSDLDKNDEVNKKCIDTQKAESLVRLPRNYGPNRHEDAIGVLSVNKPHYYGRNQTPLAFEMKTFAMEYMKHKMQANRFKTTYDLVQTILESQQELKYRDCDHSFKIHNYNNIASHHEQEHYRLPMKRLPLQIELSKDLAVGYNKDERLFTKNITWNEANNILPGYFVSCDLSCENAYCQTQSDTQQTHHYYNSVSPSEPHSLGIADIFKEIPDDMSNQNYYQSIYYSNRQTETKLTYDSHAYNNYYYGKMVNARRRQTKGQTLRFFTKQSKDNFIISDYKSLYKNDFKKNTRKISAKRTQYYSDYAKQMIDDAENIEFTTNSDTNKTNLVKCNEMLQSCSQKFKNKPSKVSKEKVGSQIPSIHNPYLPIYESIGDFGTTYTVIPSCNNSSEHYSIRNINCNMTTDHTKYTVTHEVHVNNLVQCSNTEINNIIVSNEKPYHKDDCDTLLASKPEYFDFNVNNEETDGNDNIQPINLCETVMEEHTSIEKEFAFSFNKASRLKDSLYNNIDDNPENFNRDHLGIIQTQNIDENVSHHFSNIMLNSNNFNTINDTDTHAPLHKETIIVDKLNNTQNIKERKNYDEITENDLCTISNNNFNFKDRLRFLPKGMSQIFEKSGSKGMCDYILDQDYFEDAMYNDFADDVHMQTEIYEPMVQNVETFSTKYIQKFKTKLQKDNTSLIFDENSLKEAQVLKQVDSKFIAAIMKGTHRASEDTSEYLILFDQHAVHERIRLESNLTSYFFEETWKSVPLNNITLKLSKDEILYLHNYKNKFNQLGLQWTILNSAEVSINSIPEAILGKNPREVDKVIKAVKNLIVEEINVIKLQKGCISLYPKSIMDLVCSEACRYAIKFGDKLSRDDCIELLNDLSNCKTPFQCAHGRPVMAVLLEIKIDQRDYKINKSSLEAFRLNKKK